MLVEKGDMCNTVQPLYNTDLLFSLSQKALCGDLSFYITQIGF